MINVAHITTLHPRDDVRIFQKQVTSLSNLKNVKMHMFVYDGKPSETISAVHIINIGNPFSNRFMRFIVGSVLMMNCIIINNIHVVHFHDPELSFVALFSKLLGKRVICDVHEDVPLQILNKKWIYPSARRLISKLFFYFDKIFSLAWDHIITATPSIARYYDSGKTTIICNYPIVTKVLQSNTKNRAADDHPFVYVGGISYDRGINTVMEAISGFDRKIINVVGKFDNETTRANAEKHSGWKNLTYTSWVTRAEVQCILLNSKCGIVTFHPIANHLEAQPNKLFEYLEAGIPVIASDFPLWRALVEKYDCGILVNPLDSTDIFNAMLWILENPSEAVRMGNNGRAAVLDNFNWDAEVVKLYSIYRTFLTD